MPDNYSDPYDEMDQAEMNGEDYWEGSQWREDMDAEEAEDAE